MNAPHNPTQPRVLFDGTPYSIEGAKALLARLLGEQERAAQAAVRLTNAIAKFEKEHAR